MKKTFMCLIIMVLVLFVGGCSKENKESKSCDKKFTETYSFVYKTEDDCLNNGESDYNYIRNNVNQLVISYNCDAIVDECGKTYYGVSFDIWDNEINDAKVWHY